MNFTACQGQDRFVYELLVKPENLLSGSFLDIGCNGSSNTAGLEELGWRGILMDKDPLDKIRPSKFIQCDAKEKWCQGEVGFDFLSLDVNGDSLDALKAIPLDAVKFRVITIEHDSYNHPENPDGLRIPMRDILMGAGYVLICKDVCCNPGQAFEDWWVDPSLESRACHFRCCNTYWREILEKHGFTVDLNDNNPEAWNGILHAKRT